MIRIAFYGKGGIGKSTTVSNIAAAMSASGKKVLQIGCDPKADSTINHTGGKRIMTVLDRMRENTAGDIVTVGTDGVLAVEAGGPVPGTGCAGRGIVAAFEKIKADGVYEKYRPDIVLYDVLGDVVCGGFAMPLKNGYADKVYVITSGEMMALFAADNIIRAVRNNEKFGYAKVGGIILNRRNVENEDAVVDKFAEEAGVPVVFRIPRDPVVQKAESLGKTVVEAFPKSEQAALYRALSERL